MEVHMAHAAQLSPALAAIQVSLEIDGTQVEALIPREVFEERLRSERHPQGWLASYQRNAALLDAVIRRRYAAKPQDFVVVRSSDLRATGRPETAPA
jgi:hypothetical protein